MKKYLNAVSLALVATFGAGCSILPKDATKLTQLTYVSSTHDTVTAAAKSAPSAAKESYTKLQGDFNGYVNAMEAQSTSVGGATLPFETVDFSAQAMPVPQNVTDDLASFSEAAPTTATRELTTRAIPVADVITVVFQLVGASQNDRKRQADALNQELEKFKLPGWTDVNKPSS